MKIRMRCLRWNWNNHVEKRKMMENIMRRCCNFYDIIRIFYIEKIIVSFRKVYSGTVIFV